MNWFDIYRERINEIMVMSEVFYPSTIVAFAKKALIQATRETSYWKQDDAVVALGAHDDLIAKICALDDAKLVVKYENADSYEFSYVWSHGAVWLNVHSFDTTSKTEEVEFSVVSTSQHEADQILTLFSELKAAVKVGNNPRPGAAYVMCNIPPRGIRLVSIGIAGEELIETNYMPDVVEKYRTVAKDLKAVNPVGRLSIFEGPPGTGKTHLIQSLMHDCKEFKFVIVPPKLIETLEDPGLISTYIKEAGIREEGSKDPLVIILEDADECLADRKMDNVRSLSAILNLSDGIVGKMLNLRLIATTNASVSKNSLDAAALRKGRLTAHVSVGKLSVDRTAEAWKRLTGDSSSPFHAPTALSDVYAAYKEICRP